MGKRGRGRIVKRGVQRDKKREHTKLEIKELGRNVGS